MAEADEPPRPAAPPPWEVKAPDPPTEPAPGEPPATPVPSRTFAAPSRERPSPPKLGALPPRPKLPGPGAGPVRVATPEALAKTAAAMPAAKRPPVSSGPPAPPTAPVAPPPTPVSASPPVPAPIAPPRAEAALAVGTPVAAPLPSLDLSPDPLELETVLPVSPPAPARPSPTLAGGWAPPSDAAPARPEPPLPPRPEPKLPSPAMGMAIAPSPSSVGPTPSPAAGGMATMRIQAVALAEYGEPPSGLLGTVPYALLVLSRRRQLGTTLAAITRLATAAEQDAREGFVELGLALHPRRDHPDLSAYADLLTAADQAQRLAGAQSSEWNESREAAETQRASFAAKIAQADKAAGPFRDRETKLSTQVNVFETDQRRARAKLQRVEIEMRNTTEPDRRAALEAERAARLADVDVAERHLAEIAPQLAEARHQLATLLATVKELEAQRRAIERASANTEKLYLKTAGAAEADFHDVLVRFAEAAIEDAAVMALAPREAARARQLVGARLARRRERELHEVALVSYDEVSLRKGLTILGVLAFLLFVAVVLAALI